MAVLTGYADASGRRFGDRGQCGVRARLLPKCKLQPLGGNLRAVVLHPRRPVRYGALQLAVRHFFGQIGIDTSTAAADAVAKLRQAEDAMLQAVIRHSDHLELSEQFDGTTGYQKSVRNLTWSYAAFRPRSGPVQPRPAENTRFQAARRTAIRRAGMTNRPPPGSHPVFTNGPGTDRRQPGSSLTSTSPAWQTVRRAGPVGAGKSDRVGPAARTPVSIS